MSFIDRDAMILIPRKPLFEWQNEIFPESPMETETDPFEHDGGSVYLIPELEHPGAFEEWIEDNFKFFFEDQLSGWCTDESLWPETLSYKMFRQWFHVVYQSFVMDLLDEPIEKDEE